MAPRLHDGKGLETARGSASGQRDEPLAGEWRTSEDGALRGGFPKDSRDAKMIYHSKAPSLTPAKAHADAVALQFEWLRRRAA